MMSSLRAFILWTVTFVLNVLFFFNEFSSHCVSMTSYSLKSQFIFIDNEHVM